MRLPCKGRHHDPPHFCFTIPAQEYHSYITMIIRRRATTYGCHVDLSSRLGHAASERSLFSARVSLDGYRRSDVDMAECELMNVSQCSQVPEACRDSSRESGLGSCPEAEKAVHRAATNRASLGRRSI